MEDKDFYKHPGFSLKGILRAMVVNLKYKKGLQGGSTITQQLTRILFDKRQTTLTRKIFEIYTSIYLETQFTKKEILLLYSNLAYFGHGKIGVYQASKFYFNKTPINLSIIENAFLVSLIPNPSYYSPFNNLKISQNKVNIVLSKAEENHIIPNRYKNSYFIQDFWNSIEQRKKPSTNIWPMNINKTPHYNEHIRRLIQKKTSFKKFLESNIQIYTGIDLDINNIAQQVIKKHIVSLKKNIPNIEIAMITIDNKSGDVLSAIGGSDFSINNQLLRFNQTKRPIGSLSKPFVYLAAINELNYDKNVIIKDEPISIENKDGSIWKPKNYSHKHYGDVSLELAFVKSLNIPAIKLLQETGTSLFIEYIKKTLNNKPSIPNDLSIALGSFSLSVEDIAILFESIANKGVAHGPNYIKYIKKNENITLTPSKENNFSSFIIDAYSFERIQTLLEKVFINKNGTAYKLYNQYPEMQQIKVSGKTGTTQLLRDAWFAGYTEDFTVAVWVGTDNNQSLKSSASKITLPIWIDYIKDLYRFLPENIIE